jgi:hypothetical protein
VIAVLRPAALSYASIFHAGIVKQGWKHARYGTHLLMRYRYMLRPGCNTCLNHPPRVASCCH